jgi:hypothetical protein
MMISSNLRNPGAAIGLRASWLSWGAFPETKLQAQRMQKVSACETQRKREERACKRFAAALSETTTSGAVCEVLLGATIVPPISRTRSSNGLLFSMPQTTQRNPLSGRSPPCAPTALPRAILAQRPADQFRQWRHVSDLEIYLILLLDLY